MIELLLSHGNCDGIVICLDWLSETKENSSDLQKSERTVRLTRTQSIRNPTIRVRLARVQHTYGGGLRKIALHSVAQLL